MRLIIPALLCLILVSSSVFGANEAAYNSATISGLGARNIGSATMSGRISAIAGVKEPSGKITLFVGAASGGIWKSDDGGTRFRPVFDEQPVQSIGAIAIDPKNSRNIWVGTGESWTRNSVSIGDGIYKSSDGGETWTNAGLPKSERIAQIVVSPKNSDTVFASVPGALWSDSPDRGLYRTTDGGKSWELALKGSNLSTGCSAVAIDPNDANVMFAALWDFRRKGWTFRSGGDGPNAPSGSGLFRSSDGGNTWNEITAENSKGFPKKPYGRIAIAIAPSNSKRIYAFVESTDSALFVSDDGGMWYSYNSGSKWWKGDNLPVSQFYHVSVDDQDPYRVYGGLQDNSCWIGDSQYPGGITNSRWENLYNGDGFFTFPDPSDPDYIYAEYQGGYVGRVNRHTHEQRDIQPKPNYKEKLRWNWNTPMALSPNEKGTLYIGAQFLFRSRDHGQNWARISPDLPTNDPEKQKQEQSGGITVDNSAAEMHTTIYSISESPKDKNVIWVGTDDGNLQLTRDGAKSWNNIHVPGLPPNSWVSW